MPQTKFQGIVFALIMGFCMVYCMTAYNLALQAGDLTYSIFLRAIREMWLEFVIIFFLESLVITKISARLAHRIIDPQKYPPIFFTLAMQSFTVCLTVPIITLIVTFLYHGVSADWFVLWIKQAVICFPMAFVLQIFFVGPFVRLVFRKLFSIKLHPARMQPTACEAEA